MQLAVHLAKAGPPEGKESTTFQPCPSEQGGILLLNARRIFWALGRRRSETDTNNLLSVQWFGVRQPDRSSKVKIAGGRGFCYRTDGTTHPLRK
jgi:hypothetical protein